MEEMDQLWEVDDPALARPMCRKRRQDKSIVWIFHIVPLHDVGQQKYMLLTEVYLLPTNILRFENLWSILVI